ncbi:MAG: membrane fusion protein (multidrug efflux system) [Flavobacteriaceae bacterium]|jgi:membrane fusion protein (multidrug efflux system)
MKRSQIILFAVFLVITGGIYMIVTNNKKEKIKQEKTVEKDNYVPIHAVKNEMKTLSLQSYGQVTPNSEINIAFEIQGKLERGNISIKPGTNFSIGQILYRVDNKEAYNTYCSNIASFSSLVMNVLPDIELDFPAERDKWVLFLNSLSSTKRLPELPESTTSKEFTLITNRSIRAEYFNLLTQEARLEKYFYVAPFSGTVISTSAEPGSITSPGMTIARIAKTGDFEVKVPIAMNDLELYRDKGSASFSNSDGTRIATGKILRVSGVINQQTQSADVYYSVIPIKGERVYNGMHLNVAIEREAHKNTVTIPRTCFKDDKVMVLKGNSLVPVNVIVVKKIPDSLLVTGLEDGQLLVLEQIGTAGKGLKYKGIKR